MTPAEQQATSNQMKSSGGRGMQKEKAKKIALYALSIVSLAVGVLGIADVGFFSSNSGLELLQILLGVGGLIAAVR